MRKTIEKITKSRDFTKEEEDNIINSRIKSIMIPLYMDHTIRETNHLINRIREIERK